MVRVLPLLLALCASSSASAQPVDEPAPARGATADATDSAGSAAAAPAAPTGAQDPYARDPAAPIPPPDLARGWAVRPVASHRQEVRWIKRNTTRGVRYTLQTVFAPLEGALWLNRRFEVVRRVEDVFYLGGAERNYGLLPSLSFQSGFGGGYGATAFHKDLAGNHERIALKVSRGGVFDRLYQLSVDLPAIAGSRYYLEALARYEGKSELYFYGLGNPPDDPDPMAIIGPRDATVETTFRQRRALGIVAVGRSFERNHRRWRVGGSAIYNRRRFFDGDPNDGRPIREVYDTRELPAFDTGEDVLELDAELTLDSRDRTGKTGSGFLVDGFAGGAPSLDGNLFLHYGFEASYFVTVFRSGRVVVLRGVHEGVRAADANQIPFTDLPRLGGADRLRGYRSDRFRDELATIGTVEYHYPIHHFASGVLFVEAGKVARSYDEMFASGITEKWHPGAGGGLVVHTLTDVKLRLDLAYGEGLEVFFSTDAMLAFRNRRREL